MLRKLFIRRNSSLLNSPHAIRSSYYLLHHNEYFKTLRSVENRINVYNAKIDYLRNTSSPELTHRYIQALNSNQNYEEALNVAEGALKGKWVKTGVYRHILREKKFSDEKLGNKMNGSYVFGNLSVLLGMLIFISAETVNEIYNGIREGVKTGINASRNFLADKLNLESLKTDESDKKKKKIEKSTTVKNVKDVIITANSNVTSSKVMFKDVIGIDEFKDELQEIRDYLQNPEKYEEMGAYVPRGILLVGKPGTGKTMLAQALANEAGCKFFYKSGSEFEQIFVGAGSKKVREMFSEARKHAPSIIFIDEIDSLGGRHEGAVNDTLNQILSEMDGFRKNERIILVGATNLPKALDKALTRPGRFDKTINIPLPDVKGREKMFKHYLNSIKHAKNIDPAKLSKQTSQFTGAMIKNIVNQAICHAVLNRRYEATQKDFEVVIDKEFMGIRQSRVNMTKERKMRSAVYEAGKAVASILMEEDKPLYKVSILPKGNKVNGTVRRPVEDKLSTTKTEIRNAIKVSLAGRIAEQIFYNGEMSSRCSEDYEKASDLALTYIRKLTMVEDLSLISSEKKNLSDLFNYELEKEGVKILEELSVEVSGVLSKHKEKIRLVAEGLVEKETLDKNEVLSIFGEPGGKEN